MHPIIKRVSTLRRRCNSWFCARNDDYMWYFTKSYKSPVKIMTCICWAISEYAWINVITSCNPGNVKLKLADVFPPTWTSGLRTDACRSHAGCSSLSCITIQSRCLSRLLLGTVIYFILPRPTFHPSIPCRYCPIKIKLCSEVSLQLRGRVELEESEKTKIVAGSWCIATLQNKTYS